MMSSSGAAPDPARPSRDYPGQPAMAARGFSCPRSGDGGLRSAGLRSAGPSTPGTPWACSAATRQRPAPPATSGARNTSARMSRRARGSRPPWQAPTVIDCLVGRAGKARKNIADGGARLLAAAQDAVMAKARKGSTRSSAAARRDGPLPAPGVKSGAGRATRHRDFPGLAGKQRR